MDIRSKVAARRDELQTIAQTHQRRADEATTAHRAALDARRDEVLTELAEEMSGAGLRVQNAGGHLEAVVDDAPFDTEGLKRTAIDRLLSREARRMWTPVENWQVIGLIVAGIFLIGFYGIGILLIIVGIVLRRNLNDKYRSILRLKHPEAFGIPDLARTERLVESR